MNLSEVGTESFYVESLVFSLLNKQKSLGYGRTEGCMEYGRTESSIIEGRIRTDTMRINIYSNYQEDT